MADFKIENFKFKTDWDRKVAQYFLDKGNVVLFALAVDYPGLYKIPMCYHELAKKALKELGLKWDRSNYTHPDATYRIFFIGPRPHNRGKWYRPSSTTKVNATSFKIYFYGLSNLIG